MADVVVDGGPAAGQNAPPPVVRVADPLGQEVSFVHPCVCGVLVGRVIDGTRKRASACGGVIVRWWGCRPAHPIYKSHTKPTPKKVRAHFATFLQECRPPGNEDPAEPPFYLFRLTQVCTYDAC